MTPTPGRLFVDCACGVRIEADTSDVEIVPCAIEHRSRCGREIEWHILTPGVLDARPASVKTQS